MISFGIILIWNKIIQNGDRLVELMFSVLVSYLEDWWIEPWLKPKTIKFVFTVQNYEISKGTFQRIFFSIYGSVFNGGFFRMKKLLKILTLWWWTSWISIFLFTDNSNVL
jgi:hypothetical protein